MKLYYTGALVFEGSQTDPNKSLGGLISSTEIQNEQLGNIWGAVSKYTIWNLSGKSEYRCIAIYNDSGADLTGLKAYIESIEDSDSDPFSELIANFEIGYELPTIDADCGDVSATAITSLYSKPYNITFQSAELVSNALTLPDLANGNYLIIWLKRTLKSTAKDALSSDDLVAILDGTLIPSELDQINLTFDWD